MSAQDKPVRVRATVAEVKQLRAEVEALRGAVSWVLPELIEGRSDAEIVTRVSFLNQDVARFDRANPTPSPGTQA